MMLQLKSELLIQAEAQKKKKKKGIAHETYEVQYTEEMYENNLKIFVYFLLHFNLSEGGERGGLRKEMPK